jgi:regulator of protease activity HflC (stomatin/prohibitin superfamily)
MCLFFSGCFHAVVNSGEIGLLKDGSNGQISKQTLPAGRHSIGWRDDVIIYPIQWKNFTERLEVITKDDLTVEVIATITLRPIPEQIYSLHTDIGSDYYSRIVKQDFRAAIKNTFKEYPMTQISKNSEKIDTDIQNAVTQKLGTKYLELRDINIDDINYNKQIMEAIQLKLMKEQESEAMKYELSKEKKKNEIERLNAQRDAEITIIKAKAEAEALRLVNSQITTKYIQLKAMENPNNKVIYLPIGRDGLPVLLNLETKEEKMPPIPYRKESLKKTGKVKEQIIDSAPQDE